MYNNATPEQITRRAALGFGVSLLVPLMGQAAPLKAGKVGDLNLFVFKSPDADRLVVAVALGGDRPPAKILIHANERVWTLNTVNAMRIGVPVERGDDRYFIGKVVRGDRRTGELLTAVVIDTPLNSLPKQSSIHVWAEILAVGCSRTRVGSPLFTDALALDPILTRMYHASSPKRDRLLLEPLLAKRLALTATTEGVIAHPHAHGQRLAELLLPDVIKYRPDLPVGFTFACQNGRHPADDIADLIGTILTGAPKPRPSSNAFPMVETFPYFQLPEIS